MTRIALLSIALITLAACGGDDLYAGRPDHVKRRHLAFEGAPNFRDLGGYATADGRTVRWGKFFRSDNLAHMTDADLERMSALGIHLVCDFRSEPERTDEPDRLPIVETPDVAEFPIGADSFVVRDLRERIKSGDIEGLDLRGMLIEGNRQFATTYSAQYAAMFERITNPKNLPALVHCSAGKDRAGFASAMILSVLGVPRETVMEDFLLTNLYTADATESRLRKIQVFSLFRVDPDALRPLFGVEPAYLNTAFEAIATEHGDFDSYRRNALGIDDTELEAFRELALE